MPRELLEFSALTTQEVLELSENDTLLCILPIHKTGGFMQLIRALNVPCALHLVQPTSKLDELFGSVDPKKNVTTSITPFQLENLHELDLLENFKHVLIGGGPLREEQIQGLSQLKHVTCWQTYGMTETASHVALQKIGSDPVFKPLPGFRGPQ